MKTITSSQLNLNIGYWRQHQEINIPVLCYKAKENCLGGWGTGDSTCLIGNIGGLCEECDIYNFRGDGQFQKQFGQSCLKCGKIVGMIMKMLFITIWTQGSILVTVQSTNNSNDQLKRLKLATKYYEIIFKQSLDKAGILIKMLTYYCQIILVISTFQLNLIVDISNFISPISDPTGSFSYSFDCYQQPFFLIFVFLLFQKYFIIPAQYLSTNSQISIIYGRIIWMLCLKFTYFFIYVLIYFIHLGLSQQSIKKFTLTTAILYLFTFTQPNIINELVSLVAVKTISGIDYIKGNLSYKYFTAEHFQWSVFMILPLIILQVILKIYTKLCKKLEQLNQKWHFYGKQQSKKIDCFTKYLQIIFSFKKISEWKKYKSSLEFQIFIIFQILKYFLYQQLSYIFNYFCVLHINLQNPLYIAFIIPGLIFFKLKINQKNLNTKKLRETLGYMYVSIQFQTIL